MSPEKIRFGLSSGFYRHLSLEAISQQAIDAGFDGVEADLPKDLGGLLYETSAQLLSLHLPNITRPAWVILGCEIARHRHIPIVVCHPTVAPEFLKIMSWFWQKFGVTLTIENIPPLDKHLPQIVRSGINQQYLFPENQVLNRYSPIPVTLDFGHVLLLSARDRNGQTPAVVAVSLGKRLAHVHIHDINATIGQDHLPLGRGDSGGQIAEFFQVLLSRPFSGTIILEANTSDFSDQVSWLRKLLR